MKIHDKFPRFGILREGVSVLAWGCTGLLWGAVVVGGSLVSLAIEGVPLEVSIGGAALGLLLLLAARLLILLASKYGPSTGFLIQADSIIWGGFKMKATETGLRERDVHEIWPGDAHRRSWGPERPLELRLEMHPSECSFQPFRLGEVSVYAGASMVGSMTAGDGIFYVLRNRDLRPLEVEGEKSLVMIKNVRLIGDAINKLMDPAPHVRWTFVLPQDRSQLRVLSRSLRGTADQDIDATRTTMVERFLASEVPTAGERLESVQEVCWRYGWGLEIADHSGRLLAKIRPSRLISDAGVPAPTWFMDKAARGSPPSPGEFDVFELPRDTLDDWAEQVAATPCQARCTVQPITNLGNVYRRLADTIKGVHQITSKQAVDLFNVYLGAACPSCAAGLTGEAIGMIGVADEAAAFLGGGVQFKRILSGRCASCDSREYYVIWFGDGGPTQ